MLADANGLKRMRRLLREWDARINRKVVGPNWQKRPEDRIWGFYFLEKPGSNPHWHGLIQFFPPWPDRAEEYAGRFDEWASVFWKELIPTGMADVQRIDNQSRVSDYVVKSLGFGVSYEHFIVPDEF